MRVYLIQHALAEDECVDQARPLSAQGREDVTRTAGFLSLFEKPRPAKILHSGKLRSAQTAGMFSQAWGGIETEQVDGLAPKDDPEIWQQQLADLEQDIVLVGHMPHLQRLAGLLICGDAESEPVRFRNAGVICLERGDSAWTLLWQIHPTLFYGES